MDVDLEPAEDRAVELLASGRGQGAVEPLRVVEVVEGGGEQLAADLEVATGGRQFVLGLCSFVAQGLDLGFELGLRPGGVTDEVEEVVLLLVDLLQAGGQRRLDLCHGCELVTEGCLVPLADGGDELGIEADLRVVLEDRCLDVFDQHVWLVAELELAAAAEEVVVDPAVAGGAHDQDPVAAAVAPDGAFQVVVVAALAYAGATVAVEDALHGVEEIVVHDRVVAPVDPFAFELDLAGVVAVAQDAAQCFAADGTLGPIFLGAGGQAGFGDALQESVEREPAGAHPDEGLMDERCALLVEFDGAHDSVLDLELDVAVAELGAAVPAAALVFLPHALDHFGAQVGRVELGD